MTEKPEREDAAAPQPKSDYFVGAFAKGLSVLQTFGEGASALTLSEVAKRTGLSRPGARRYLLTLQDLGYATQTGRHFSLTPRVLSLGYAYLSSFPLWLFAEPIVEKLMHDIGETCSLTVLDDTDVVFVLIAPVHRVLHTSVRTGSRVPAYCSSMGHMLLSGLSDARLDEYLARVELTPFTPHTITDKAVLLNRIKQARTNGYATVSGEMEEGVAGLSVPIFDIQGRVIAALNTSINRMSPDALAQVTELLPKLQRAAAELNSSSSIAHRPASITRP